MVAMAIYGAILLVVLALMNAWLYLPYKYEKALAEWQNQNPITSGMVQVALRLLLFVCAVGFLSSIGTREAPAYELEEDGKIYRGGWHGGFEIPGHGSNCISFSNYSRQVVQLREEGYSEVLLWNMVLDYAGRDMDPGEALLAREIMRRIYAGLKPEPSWWGCTSEGRDTPRVKSRSK